MLRPKNIVGLLYVEDVVKWKIQYKDSEMLFQRFMQFRIDGLDAHCFARSIKPRPDGLCLVEWKTRWTGDVPTELKLSFLDKIRDMDTSHALSDDGLLRCTTSSSSDNGSISHLRSEPASFNYGQSPNATFVSDQSHDKDVALQKPTDLAYSMAAAFLQARFPDLHQSEIEQLLDLAKQDNPFTRLFLRADETGSDHSLECSKQEEDGYEKMHRSHEVQQKASVW